MKDEGGKAEDLKSRTKEYALRIIRLYSSLPKTKDAQVIGHQFLKSGTYVGANYREASRARSNAEFISKLGIIIQELDETSYWLELLFDGKINSSLELKSLLSETNELLAIFTSIIKKMRNK
jgi:four helix bundle protein